jgi:hypothetical protein
VRLNGSINTIAAALASGNVINEINNLSFRIENVPAIIAIVPSTSVKLCTALWVNKCDISTEDVYISRKSGGAGAEPFVIYVYTDVAWFGPKPRTSIVV